MQPFYFESALLSRDFIYLSCKITNMKRKLLFGATFLFLAWAATSCEALSECKFCKTVSRDSSTGDVNEGFETEYCGAALIAIEAKDPVTVGTVTTTWECR